MKKMLFYLLLILPCWGFAQIGIKAGLNFANVTNASSINNSSRTGYHAGIFLGSSFQKILGFRIEIGYSKQGYDYTSGANHGNVGLDYITSAELLTIGITRYFQVQLGFQLGYLLNAKADSSNAIAGLPGSYQKILDIYNRIDYGFAGGVEIHPVGGLLIGGRLNVSLSDLYKDAQTSQSGSFSGINLKNNVFQVFAGWRFGKQHHSTKKKEQ
jgi:Outer membrane protein beta-barrel domain